MAQVLVDDGLLETKEIGDGPPVLLVHDAVPGVWGALPEALRAAGHHVIGYDRRGYGDAEFFVARGPGQHASDVRTLLSRRAAGPAVVVGWGHGAVYALDAAVKAEEGEIAGLVLIEPSLHLRRHPTPPVLAARVRARVFRYLGAADNAAEHWAGLLLEPGDLTEAAHKRLRKRDAMGIVRDVGHGFGEHVRREDIAALTVPARVLRGERARPEWAAAADRAAALLGVGVTVVPGAGHAVHLSSPAPIVGAVADLVG